ncbi:hypothetical protein LNTAR_21655 [Lentisphaera araneosa HTCC2155]|uniref:Uncharacterized protein n=1 Tax=Lentisphaera araneosa HTCC2155 TaxID=313628 RepID=A6DM65_9BACT|nr:hypothetical protein [Lentisphaera araneosa]EDM27363.1 hypothetical protein LNTAR_21655 [Lentisphaera araneosa HTCC2155]
MKNLQTLICALTICIYLSIGLIGSILANPLTHNYNSGNPNAGLTEFVLVFFEQNQPLFFYTITPFVICMSLFSLISRTNIKISKLFWYFYLTQILVFILYLVTIIFSFAINEVSLMQNMYSERPKELNQMTIILFIVNLSFIIASYPIYKLNRTSESKEDLR